MVETETNFTRTGMETLQWFVFLLASAVALPIVVGAVFQLSFMEVAGLMQRTFFLVGITSLLQGLFGHRLPIAEGPAGIWMSIFAIMAVTGAQQGLGPMETLQTLATTMILAGLFLLLFGIFKIAEKVLPLFTPLVTGAFLFLLTVQLGGTFLKGMLGVQGGVEAIHGIEALLAFLTFFIVLGLSIFGKGWLSSYAVLIGIVIGWISYVLLIGRKAENTGEIHLFAAPEIFAWGLPRFDWGVVPVAFIIAVILLSNLVASVVPVSQLTHGKASYDGSQINKGSTVLGLNQGIAGCLSTIANVPLAASAGFIRLTGQKRKAPFIYASILLMLIAFFPPIVTLISGIPAPIANAALLAAFVQLMGLGLNNIASQELDSRRLTIISTSLLIGIGIMFLPLEVFAEFPALAQNLLSNGLLVGTILVIVLEQLWKEESI